MANNIRTIGARVVIDGEKESKATIASINTGLKTLKSQMAAVSAEYKGNEDGVDALNAKNELLKKQYEQTIKKLEELEKAHANAAKQVGEEDNRTQKWAQSVNYTQKQLAELERQMQEVERELDPLNRSIKEYEDASKDATTRIGYMNSELKALDAQYANNRESADYLTKRQEILDRQYQESINRVDSLRAALKRVEQQSGRNSDEYRRMEGSLNEARAEMYSAENATKDMDRQSKGLGDTINDLASKFGFQLPDGIAETLNHLGKLKDKSTDTGGSVKTSADGMGDAFSGMGGPITAVVTAIAGIAIKAAEVASDVEFSAARMKVALGLTDEEAKKAEKSLSKLYTSGLADSRDEAEQALTAVMRLMGASGEEAENFSLKLLTIQKVFGEDFAETARTASTLMNTFGITGGQALDIITTGLQTSANKNGDLLDVLNEYSPSFERLGDDAQTFLSRVTAATDAGAFSADKAADAYKEFYNKAAGYDTTFMEALDALGLQSDTVIRSLLSGGDTASVAMDKVITKLENVGTPAEQARLAAALFGSQWEDVGTQSILAMNKIEGKIFETKDSARQAVSEILDTTSVESSSFWKIFETLAFTPDIIGTFYSFGNSAGENSVDGYVQGIENKIDEGEEAMRKAAGKFSAAFDEELDINSPSGVFEDSGEYSADGYIKGWQNRLEQIKRQIATATSYIASAAVPTSQGPAYKASTVHTPPAQPQYIFQKGAFVIDAQNVREFNDIINIVQSAPQIQRAGGGRKY